jgi:glycosyltransferase involved in cell wall biosynthesis
VHNGGRELAVCLTALGASTRPPYEVIVVDDASTDGSAEDARAHGATVLGSTGRPSGPAVARNRAALAARGDVLVFVDADVAVHPDALALIEARLAQNAEVDAVFGSYDDTPTAPGLVSRYKNLLHHYVHQHGQREASTFWSGCGAIRRIVFLRMGGFSEAFDRPSVEDIELGMRLRAAGRRIWLCPEVMGTHLKRWTLRSLLYTDVFCRAVPWARLIVGRRQLPASLNLDWRSRLSALAAWVFAASLLGSALRTAWLGIAGLALAGLLTANWSLYVFFWRHGGIAFAAGSGLLHLLYLLYSSATLAACIVADALVPRG